MDQPPYPPIALRAFRDLWIHAGTACNLSCPFCHEGSKPGDARIAAPTLAELATHLEDAAARGVERFAFTGGEPLIVKGILDILLFSLRLRPVLVLTNGTAPFIRRSHQLALLREAPHPLSFRVSIDHPEEARHDAGRGLKNFRKALEGLRLLHVAGFDVGITRQITRGEDADRVASQFRQLLRRHRLPEDLPIVALPDLAALGDTSQLLDAASHPLPQAAVPEPACARSRMLLRAAPGMRFHACPLTDDLEEFNVGAQLETAVAATVNPVHARCSVCRSAGVDYVGSGPGAARGALRTAV